MAIVSMKQLLEAGVHFGHQTRRWNPKMAPYIFTERNGIYIIDLQKTVKKVEECYNFLRELAAQGGKVLFVWNEETGPERNQGRIHPCWHVLCQRKMARRYADQLQDHPDPYQTAP